MSSFLRTAGATVIAFAAAAGSCSLVVDTAADQCATTDDCRARGGAFAETVCGPQRTCIFSCTTNVSCSARLGVDAVCLPDRGTCAPLLSQDCPTLLAEPGDLARDPVILGLLLPQTGPNAAANRPRAQAVDLARREIMKVAGGIPRGDGVIRPLAILSCTDADDPVRAARHLAEVVRVPAFVGPAFSGVTTTVATSVTIPAGVLLISPSATSPTLTDLADDGLVWRTAPSDVAQASAMARLVETRIEPALSAALAPGEKMRLAVVHKGDAYGVALGEALFKSLFFNGASAAGNGPSFLKLDYGDPATNTAAVQAQRYAATLENLIAFRPHLVIDVGTTEAVTEILAKLEATWPDAVPRTRYLLADGLRIPELIELVTGNEPLRRRILGTIAASESPTFELFRTAYLLEYKDGSQPDAYAAGAYDATYLLSYAVAAAGAGPLSGAVIRNGLVKTAPGPDRIPVTVGPGDFNKAAAAMRGAGIDVTGASGLLDWDVRAGEAPADIQVWCITAAAEGPATFAPSGLVFRAKTGTFEGVSNCP